MEIKTTNTASINSKAVPKLQDLLLKFDATAFKAIISSKISNQFFSINTKAGNLKIATDLPLQIGDELTLKVKLDKVSQVNNLEILKINRPIINNSNTAKNSIISKELSPTIILNNQIAIKNIPQKQDHFIAKVISHDKTSVNLQSLKGDSFSMSKEHFKNTVFNIQKGEFLAIKRTPEKNIEIQHISKEQLLHQTQRQLLPKQQPAQQTHQKLSQAAFKLFEALNIESKHLVKQTKSDLVSQSKQILPHIKEINLPIKNEQQKITSPQNQQSQLSSKETVETLIKTLKTNSESVSHKKITLSQNTVSTLNNIKQELHNLLTTHRISFKFLGADTIQKLLSSLNSLSQTQNPITDNHSFSQKLSLVNQSIIKLLTELEVNTLKNKNTSPEDDTFLNGLKTTLKEALQSFESSLHKILFQHTSAKLNQEINNTLLINTQIPFETEKQTKDINLKIKQHKKESEEQDDTWEIHLSLEMGQLGLISTKIILKEQYDVSIQFWAELINTKQLMEDKKGIFKQQMNNAGFSLKSIDIYQGKKIEESIPMNISNKQFIDINV